MSARELVDFMADFVVTTSTIHDNNEHEHEHEPGPGPGLV